MAERRMFAKTIIDSDSFLDMPLSTQALYFHLSMRGDDEGFVNNPKKVSRMVGASDDELKVLIAKKFIILFDSGVIVIKHWKLHNYIRGDRIKETNYLDERDMLLTNENGSYTLIKDDGVQMSVTCQSNVSIGEDSIGKVSIVEYKDIDRNDFDAFWKAYPKKVGKDAALKAWNKKKHKPHMEFILESIERYKLSKTVRDGFTCNPATWINEGRWSDEVTLSDYDKAKAIQEHTGMSPSETLDIQLANAQREWEGQNR